ncbi:MAG: CatB-related O-acetyltransferase [Methanosphaera sp.]|nr:CatB-related O-acetyltransferase [Methanosphaera sp.]
MLYNDFYEYCKNQNDLNISEINEGTFELFIKSIAKDYLFILITNIQYNELSISFHLKKTIINKAPKIRNMITALSSELNSNLKETSKFYIINKNFSDFKVVKVYLSSIIKKLIHINSITNFYFNVNNRDDPVLKNNDIAIPKSSKIAYKNLVIGRNTKFHGDLQSKFGYVYLGQFIAGGYNIKFIAGNHLTQLPNLQISLQKTIYGEKSGHLIDQGFIDVGNNVWIGDNVIILKNVTIGDGAIIGSGAVVTHDVPPFAVVAGVPAKIIKYRFSESVIKQMMKIQWWNWPMERILAEKRFFSTQIPPDVDFNVYDLLDTKSM